MNGPFKVTSKQLGPDFDWPNLHFAYLLLYFTLVFHTGQLGLDNFPPLINHDFKTSVFTRIIFV